MYNNLYMVRTHVQYNNSYMMRTHVQ